MSDLLHLPLKIIFAVHFVLISWAVQGAWCPPSAMLYNLVFFVCLLWAIHNGQSDEPIQLALIVNILSILLDVIILSIYFPSSSYASEKFSAAFLIINMIVRVVSTFVLLRVGQTRGGMLAGMFTLSPTMGFGREDYEDISQPVPGYTDFTQM
ncbi:uncharacterized protein LOC105702963 [Orussus abietinus]|uniref:uncharacterized protein LOC105702963 n=1 Tax=Orussus abietinus TaxID=222816 RepID=UPI000625C711|nr:uncharacterized protein LOC105702963 [Orussus abietinus]